MQRLADPVVVLAVSWGVATLLAIASLHKMSERQRFAAVLGNYRLIPSALLTIFSRVIPLLEAAIALGLLFSATRASAGLAAAALIGMYAIAMAVNIARGNLLLDCGCRYGVRKTPVAWGLVYRNLAMIVVLLCLQLEPLGRSLGLFDFLVVGFAVAVLLLIYATVDVLIEQWPKSRGMV